MIGGGSRISQDVAPYVKAAGSPPRNAGINWIGLARRGFSPEAVKAAERAYRLFFRDGHTVSQAVAAIRREFPGQPEAEHFARFCETSVRGVARAEESTMKPVRCGVWGVGVWARSMLACTAGSRVRVHRGLRPFA
jgi:hypothetical protein